MSSIYDNGPIENTDLEVVQVITGTLSALECAACMSRDEDNDDVKIAMYHGISYCAKHLKEAVSGVLLF